LGPEEYIKRGWKIFPCHAVIRGKCTCGKPDCKNPGKHPRTRNGHTDATSDLQTVRTWWTTWPDANIAVATGAVSGIWAVDVDPRHGGFDSLNEFEETRPEGILPATLTSVTGGSGRHIIFRYPDDGSRVPTRNPWKPGIEVKSDGGYIILPPGTHISGGRYQWINWETHEPVLAPRDLLESIRDVRSGSSGREELPSTSDILAGIPEGKRDDHLFRAACRLRRQLGDNERPLIAKIIADAAANAVPPFDHDEAMRKVDQAFKQDHTDDITQWDYKTDDGEKLENLTDVGNKNRFINAYGHKYRYVPQLGWLQWSDTGWCKISEEPVLHEAESVADIIFQEAATKVTDSALRLKFVKFSHASESAGSVAAIIRLAQNDPRYLRDVSEFDTNVHEISCRNGIVDLRTGTIREFTRDDLVTKNTNVVFDPLYVSAQWERFLWDSTQGDIEMIRYLQLAAGYTLTGDIGEECFFILTGPKQSGKSTFVDAIQSCLGQYATTTQSETFMYRRGKDTARDELATFVGMRMVAMSEIKEGEGFNDSLIKQFTGGDRVKAKMLYKDPFEYQPQFKLWIATNHDPASQDDALMRRLKRIQFQHTIPPEQRDPALKAHLKDSESGGRAVLAWAVRGAMEFLKIGRIPEPAKITMAVASYAAEHDMFTQFLNECFDRVEGSSVTYQTINDTHKLWAGINNEWPLKRPVMKQKLAERGFLPNLDNTYGNLRLKQMRVAADGSGVYWT
jgi:putative DNA primase/helicase